MAVYYVPHVRLAHEYTVGKQELVKIGCAVAGWIEKSRSSLKE